MSLSRKRVLDELLRDAPTNEAIGKRLYLTVNTVKSHISWLLAATDTRTRADLILAIKTGRVQIEPLRCENCGASRGKHYRGCEAKEST